MYHFEAPALPEYILEQPSVKEAGVYGQSGKILNIRAMMFSGMQHGAPIKIELFRNRDEGEPVEIDSLPPQQIFRIYYSNCQDARLFFDQGNAENQRAKLEFLKAGSAGVMTAAFGICSFLSYKAQQKPINCHDADHVTIQQCNHPDTPQIKAQGAYETPLLGVAAAILGIATIAICRRAIRHLDAVTPEFTKAALAIRNARTCEKIMNQDVFGPQPSGAPAQDLN